MPGVPGRDLLVTISNELSDSVRGALNRQGYGFQYRVLAECLANRATHPPHSRWQLSADEYPVDLKNQTTHIDFVLAAGTHLLVAECKRASSWRWCFARSRHSLAATRRPIADYLVWANDSHPPLMREVRTFGSDEHAPYHVAAQRKKTAPNRGQEAKNGAQRSESEFTKDFDNAVSQVFRARGGLIDDLGPRETLRYGGGAIVPVIFTTAELLVTDADLAESDLNDGAIAKTIGAGAVNWLWYNHNLGSALRPTMPRRAGAERGLTKSGALQKTLLYESMRSVAIVRPEGISHFLRDLSIDLALDSDAL